MNDNSWALSLTYREVEEEIYISNDFHTRMAQTSFSMEEEDIIKVKSEFYLQTLNHHDIDEELVVELVLLAAKTYLENVFKENVAPLDDKVVIY